MPTAVHDDDSAAFSTAAIDAHADVVSLLLLLAPNEAGDIATHDGSAGDGGAGHWAPWTISPRMMGRRTMTALTIHQRGGLSTSRGLWTLPRGMRSSPLDQADDVATTSSLSFNDDNVLLLLSLVE